MEGGDNSNDQGEKTKSIVIIMELLLAYCWSCFLLGVDLMMTSKDSNGNFHK